MAAAYLYVIAGTWKEARAYAQSRGSHQSQMVYVDREGKIRDLRREDLFVLPGSELSTERSNIIQMAKLREFNIIYV